MRSEALQQAIYDRLTAYVPISGTVTGVYTDVPQNADSADDTAFPYITIGFAANSPMDTKDSNGSNTLVDVHIWSRSPSALTWRAIADDVYDALQKHDLVIAGANLIDCRFNSAVEYTDPDGVTKHHVSTFRITYFDA